MRNLLLILIIFSAFKVNAAVRDSIPNGVPIAYPKGWQRWSQQVMADSGFVTLLNDTSAKVKAGYAAIRFFTDNAPYYWDGSKWTAFASSVFKIVDSLSDLYAVSGLDSEVVFVKDSLRGGFFHYKTTANYNIVDSVISVPCVNGYFVRDISQTNAILTKWYGVKGDSVTDNTTKFQKALDMAHLIGGSTVLISKGYFLTGKLVMYDNISLQGIQGVKNNPLNGQADPVRLLRRTTDTCILDVRNARGFAISNLSFVGNGASDARFGYAILGGDNTGANLVTLNHFYDFDICIYGGGDGANFRVIQNEFTDNRLGIKFVKDSHIEMNGFHRCKSSIYLNNGQVDIDNNFIEFGGDNTGGTAIYLDANCTRITITNNRTDRNRGYDVRVLGSDSLGKRPRIIQINNNLFKRAGWGDSILTENRNAIEVDSSNYVQINDNHFYFSDYDASNIEGWLSPTHAIVCVADSFLVVKGNDMQNMTNKVDLNGGNYRWYASSHNSEYYFGQNSLSHKGWIFDPNNVEYNNTFSYMDSGTVGSLTSNQWGWGDNDEKGQSTIYVKLSGGINPDTLPMGTLYAYYNRHALDLISNKFVQTDNFKDFETGFVMTGDSVTFTLNVGDGYANELNSIVQYKLIINSREINTSSVMRASSQLGLLLVRSDNDIYPTIEAGTLQSWNVTNSAVISKTAVTDGLQVYNIKSDGIGAYITITLKYTSTHSGTSNEYTVQLQ